MVPPVFRSRNMRACMAEAACTTSNDAVGAGSARVAQGRGVSPIAIAVFCVLAVLVLAFFVDVASFIPGVALFVVATFFVDVTLFVDVAAFFGDTFFVDVDVAFFFFDVAFFADAAFFVGVPFFVAVAFLGGSFFTGVGLARR